jgi:hypothetical protein
MPVACGLPSGCTLLPCPTWLAIPAQRAQMADIECVPSGRAAQHLRAASEHAGGVDDAALHANASQLAIVPQQTAHCSHPKCRGRCRTQLQRDVVSASASAAAGQAGSAQGRQVCPGSGAYRTRASAGTRPGCACSFCVRSHFSARQKAAAPPHQQRPSNDTTVPPM